MATDINSLTRLISEFRALQTKDAISPDSLGYLLQQIVDLLASAGTPETVGRLSELLKSLNLTGTVISSLSQPLPNKEQVVTNITKVNLDRGVVSTEPTVIVPQATNKCAGAMSAQQVTDLEKARKGVTEMYAKIAEINEVLEEVLSGLSDKKITLTTKKALYPFSIFVEEGILRIQGWKDLVQKGYVPYLFRSTHKRNAYHHRNRNDDDEELRYCARRKGWNLWGSVYSVMISDGVVLFSMNEHRNLSTEACGWDDSPENLIKIHKKKIDGLDYVAWGRNMICLHDKKSLNKPRMVKLKFALAFGPEILPGSLRVTPDLMVTPLVEFSVIYDPYNRVWGFGRTF